MRSEGHFKNVSDQSSALHLRHRRITPSSISIHSLTVNHYYYYNRVICGMYTEFHEPEIDIQTIKYLIWLALSKKIGSTTLQLNQEA